MLNMMDAMQKVSFGALRQLPHTNSDLPRAVARALGLVLAMMALIALVMLAINAIEASSAVLDLQNLTSDREMP